MSDRITRQGRDRPDETLTDEGTSLSERIHAAISERILSGAWRPGHRIPNETELARRYGCARMTVNKVMTRLVAAGLIERRRRAGSFVRTPGAEAAVLEIGDIAAEVTARGRDYAIRVLRRRQRTSRAADRALLGLAHAMPVLEIDCLHLADDRPHCLEQRLINLAVVPAARDQVFDHEAPGPWLISHVPWSEAEHRIRAEAAQPDAARTLGLRPGTACLVVERRTWREGAPVTHVRLTYPGGSHEMVARFKPAGAG